MKSQPRVSIVMPCYNAEAHLPKSIGSVLAQTFKAWELIAVDDGSTDNTRSWLQNQTDERIRTFSQINKGVSAARNAGLTHCTGDYTAFLDADDTWSPDFLQSMVSVLDENPDAVLAYCGWQNLGIAGSRGEPFIPPDYQDSTKTLALLEGCRWPIHACLTRRSTIEAVGGFDPRLKIGEDYLLWMEVAARGRIIRVPNVLAFYHHHGGPQATRDKARGLSDTLFAKQIFLERHPDLARKIPAEQLEALTWGRFIGGANQLYWQGEVDAVRPLFRKALRAGRGSLRDKLRMTAAFLPAWCRRGLSKLVSRP